VRREPRRIAQESNYEIFKLRGMKSSLQPGSYYREANAYSPAIWKRREKVMRLLDELIVLEALYRDEAIYLARQEKRKEKTWQS
jgi:hypothetical protein